MMTGQEIRQLRYRLKLNQTELAEKVGTTQITVSRWESKGQIPSYKYIQALEHLRNQANQKKCPRRTFARIW